MKICPDCKRQIGTEEDDARLPPDQDGGLCWREFNFNQCDAADRGVENARLREELELARMEVNESRRVIKAWEETCRGYEKERMGAIEETRRVRAELEAVRRDTRKDLDLIHASWEAETKAHEETRRKLEEQIAAMPLEHSGGSEPHMLTYRGQKWVPLGDLENLRENFRITLADAEQDAEEYSRLAESCAAPAYEIARYIEMGRRFHDGRTNLAGYWRWELWMDCAANYPDVVELVCQGMVGAAMYQGMMVKGETP